MVSKIAIIIIITAFASVFLASAAFAEASINVPVHNWAYDDLDVLNRAGLIDGSGLDTKPITRMDAARLIETAINRIQNGNEQFSVFDEVRLKRSESALNRLVEEFRPELVRLGVTTVAKDDKPVSSIRFRLADPIDSDTIYADLKDTKDILFENKQGLHLKQGFNEITSMRTWVEFNDYLAMSLEPAIVLSRDRRELNIKTGYVKLSYWNIELEAGRDTMWWGPGYNGAMLLSDNAYPLNLIKLKTAHPFTLPGNAEKLGKWNIDFFVAQLDKGRDFPHAKLGGLRVEWAPNDYLTFGVSRTAIFGGEGRPRAGLKDYFDMFIAWNELSQNVNENKSNQLAAFDFKLNIPWRDSPFNICTNLQLYGEWAGEDQFAPWQNEAPGYLAGILVSDLFASPGLDFRTEIAHTDAAWYIHGIYTSGYRYKGDIIGHYMDSMGGDADDIFMRLSKDFTGFSDYFKRIVVGGQLDYERHKNFSPFEREYEARIDGTFYLSDAKSVKLLYAYQGYDNFNNVSGSKAHNNIFETEATIKF